ncbi:phosphoadenosine phosphosulfate reductase family protein [uncultured Tissierella sp.]|uniref:phosphoadenosine phosphosulfate reductase domain-containing protein n=1 Tax=uncultured Tissierella sp. TaxID=448160 RepID=UPI002803E2BD|nr:phosphoadenosine phosphosulfate reductase family protein [uncultured Tissierella sp.]MDU5080248.1 phosphoadenosine phosphosulfate reductase family protein [Bacillota bacterium]
MKTILGKKQSINNEEWIKAMENIEEYVTREELELLVALTVDEIKNVTRNKKTAYAWSGGKDSLVLGHICERAGIKDCILGICNLEYPAFLDWIDKNKPNGLEIINTGQDLEWLVKHQNMLFPQDSSKVSRWFSIVQHNAQYQYYKKHDIDILILGRRKADGNYVGKGTNIYTDRKGVTRYSPLSHWKHEFILAYIHYYKLKVPPIYTWYNGYKCGTHPWPARQYTGDVNKGWEEIYTIDQSIVDKAAGKIESAKLFKEGLK